ncbi:VOC family protein [Arthrobacter sp. NicSoilC12]|uniref:VOC family protein n=1 Tax=Arthrobacter sp. NicSoilC12 TaxID=2831001 RepID=UPI001CC3DC3B|nr:VOC family protein [Arthrobacter sp. NicSoilC12]GIU54379.1 hypothetical protein NicSoilC12_01280 [Arthrobacter sp. NicSoilC12]
MSDPLPQSRRPGIRAAMFVDFDNVYTGLMALDPAAAKRFAEDPKHWTEALAAGGAGEESRRFLIRNCYLNPVIYSKYRPYWTRAGFRVIDCPSLTQRGKSSTDINLVLDAMDALAGAAHIEEFFVASADADFTSLVQRFREYSPNEFRKEPKVPNDLTELVSVRYMVADVDAAVDFYTTHLGFTVRMSAAPAFADVTRGRLRLLLSGPASSAGRPMPDGTVPVPGGWNRIHIIVGDIAAEVERLRATGVTFRNDIVKGPGGQQILLEDPSGNVVELFQPAGE